MRAIKDPLKSHSNQCAFLSVEGNVTEQQTFDVRFTLNADKIFHFLLLDEERKMYAMSLSQELYMDPVKSGLKCTS